MGDPAGPGPQLELLYECRLCGVMHLRGPAGEPVVGPPLRPVVDVELPGCACPCHLVVQDGLVPCPECDRL